MKKKVIFKNKNNNLIGILSNPSQDKEKPIIIFCHGLISSKESGTYKYLEKCLNNEKISTLKFDFYAHGESEGEFEKITVSKAVSDILSAIKYLKKLGYTKIGLMGSSFGGLAANIVASKSSDLFVLALRSPVSNYEEKEIATKSKKELDDWKRKGYRIYVSGDGRKLKIYYNLYLDFKNNNGYLTAKKIKIPTLIVHGDKDEIVPCKQSVKTSSIIQNCMFVTVKGADHRYSNPKHREKSLKTICKFLVSYSQEL